MLPSLAWLEDPTCGDADRQEHPRPRNIRVGLVQAGRVLRLADDGSGVPPGGPDSGCGTRNIVERLTPLRGTATWHADAGTRLEVVTPLRESQ